MARIEFDSMGPSGNIYAILCLCREVLTRLEIGELASRVFNSAGSYEDALAIVREYVDLIDVRGCC